MTTDEMTLANPQTKLEPRRQQHYCINKLQCHYKMSAQNYIRFRQLDFNEF